MKKILIFAFLVCPFFLGAQVRTAYFMENSLERIDLNPAFQPYRGFFTIPAVGGFGVSMGTNTLMVDNILFPRNDGKLTLFMDKSVSTKSFLSNLAANNRLNLDSTVDIIKGGWFRGGAFWSYGINMKSVIDVNLPKALFELVKAGSGVYNIENLKIHSSTYAEVFVGYSRPINKKLTVGGRLKVLTGLASMRMDVESLTADITADRWNMTSRGTLEMSMKGLPVKERNGYFDGFDDDKMGENLGTAGMGGAIDLGATYKLTDRIILSASVLDLGMLAWSAAASHRYAAADQFTFTGFDLPVDGSDGVSMEDQIKDLEKKASKLFQFKPTTGAKSYTTMLPTTVMVGGQYRLPEYHLTAGLLATARFYSSGMFTEVTASANYQPYSWLGASLSYSAIHGYNTLGVAVNLSPGGFNFFLGSDYIPLRISTQGVPLHARALNFKMGMSLMLGKRRPN